MWDLIVSVPDHCLSFYFVNYELEEKRHKEGRTLRTHKCC